MATSRSSVTRGWHPHRLDRWDLITALVVFAGSLGLLLATMQMGFTRDESFYFHAAHEYVGWFRELWRNFQAGTIEASFSQANIDRHWAYNREHPVLMKAAFALSHELFHEKLDWLSSSTALRLPTSVVSAFLLSIVYLWGRQLFGRLAGIFAVGALLLQPRFFFHAHMAAFDAAITAFWVATVYAYWRSLDSRRWALVTGVAWGIALSIKLNAFFLPAVLGLHWLLTSWRGFSLAVDPATGNRSLRLPRFPLAFVSMIVVGPILFYALWPRHWFDTFERVQWYMQFHLRHVHYFVYYFGQNIQQPPLPVSYPWVMTLVTVPATILLAALVGAGFYLWRRGSVSSAKAWIDGLRRRRLPDHEPLDSRGTGLLLAINVLFPIALISLPETPIFGGTKHWMPAMPFVAILAGAGVVWAAESLNEWMEIRARLRTVSALVLAACMLVPAALGTIAIHPFGTSYYNELIGSHRGAADARMFRQFWGYASRQGLDWLNENAPKNARIYTHNTTGYAWGAYEREGLARKDFRPSRLSGSDYTLYHHQKAFVFQLADVWEEYGTKTPVHVVTVDGVPVLSIYAREHAAKKPKGKTESFPQ